MKRWVCALVVALVCLQRPTTAFMVTVLLDRVLIGAPILGTVERFDSLEQYQFCAPGVPCIPIEFPR